MAQQQSVHHGGGTSSSSSSDKKHYHTRSASKTNQTSLATTTCSEIKTSSGSSNMQGESRKESPSNIQHKNPSSDGMNFLCPQCGSGFSKRKDLIIHKQEHGKDHPFSCQLCSKSFLNKLHLESHQETTHPKETSCSSCHETFLNEECFKNHKCAQSESEKDSKESDVKQGEGSSKDCCTLSVFRSKDSSKCQYCNDTSVQQQSEKEPSISSHNKDHKIGPSSAADVDNCCCTLKQLLEQAIDKQLPLCGSDCDTDSIADRSQRTVSIGRINIYNEDSLDSDHNEDANAPHANVDMDVVCDDRSQTGTIGGDQRSKFPRSSCDRGEGTGEAFRQCGSTKPPVVDITEDETGGKDQRLISPHRYIGLVNQRDHKSMSIGGHSSREHIVGHSSQRLDGSIPDSRRAGCSRMESNNNKEDYPIVDVDREDPMDFSISRQPLVKSLTMGKAPVVVSRRKGGKKGPSSGHKFASMENKSDELKIYPDKPNEMDQNFDDTSRDKVGVCTKKQKLIHTITDKLTEAIIHDLKAPDPNPEMKPLDLSIAKPIPIRQSFADRSNLCASNASPRRPRENLRIQIPTSFQGPGDTAIEKELLKFYGQAITYIGLTVYREHEKELYGHDLSQVGLYNTGKASDIRGHKQP